MLVDAFHYSLLKHVKPFVSVTAKAQFRSCIEEDGIDEALSYAFATGNIPTEDVRTILCYGVCDFDTEEDNYSEPNAQRLEELLDAFGL